MPVFDDSHRDPQRALHAFADGSVRSQLLGGRVGQARFSRDFLAAYLRQLSAWIHEEAEADVASEMPVDVTAWREYREQFGLAPPLLSEVLGKTR